jgi:hypothetical protein
MLNSVQISGFRNRSNFSRHRHLVRARQEGVLPVQRIQVAQASVVRSRRRVATHPEVKTVLPYKDNARSHSKFLI